MQKQNILYRKSKNAHVGADSISAQCNKDINNMPVGAGLVSAQDHNGITLIALVITIIILLILAGVVLNLTLGENGIIKYTEFARNKYQNSVEKETNQLAFLDSKMDDYVEEIGHINSSIDSYIDMLWTNEFPTSNFSASTISCDLSKYEKIVIKAGMSKNKYTEKNEVNYIVINVGEQLEYCMGHNTNSTNAALTMIRTITTTSSSIVISDATCKQGTGVFNDNSFLIPLNIYGIK